MLKKLLLTAASVFLAWQSWKLAPQLAELPPVSLPLTIFIAWLFSLFVTGIFAFAGFAYPTQRLLPEGYYRIRNPRLLRRGYRLLGVHYFRQALLATLWRDKKRSRAYFNGRRDGLATLLLQSKKSEFGHLLPFLILLLYASYLLYLGSTTLAVALTLWNLAGNFYPIVLQRYHRLRIDRLAVRSPSRPTKAGNPPPP